MNRPSRSCLLVVLAIVLVACHGSDGPAGLSQRGGLEITEIDVLTDETGGSSGDNAVVYAGHSIEVRTKILVQVGENLSFDNVGVSYDILLKDDVDRGTKTVRQTTLGGDCLEQVGPGAYEFVAMLEIPTNYEDEEGADEDDGAKFVEGEYYLVASIDPLDQIEQGDAEEKAAYPDEQRDFRGRNVATILIRTDKIDKHDVILHEVILDSEVVVLDGYEDEPGDPDDLNDDMADDGGNDGADGTLDNSHLGATLDVEVSGRLGPGGATIPITATIQVPGHSGEMPLQLWDAAAGDHGGYVDRLEVRVQREGTREGADEADTHRDGCESVHVGVRIPGDPDDLTTMSARRAVEAAMDAQDVRTFTIHFYVNRSQNGGFDDGFEGGMKSPRRESDNQVTVEVAILPPPGNEIENAVAAPGARDVALILASPPDVDFPAGVNEVAFSAWIENIELNPMNPASKPWPDRYYACTASRDATTQVVVSGVVLEGLDDALAADLIAAKYTFTERSRLIASAGERQSYEKGFGDSTFGAKVLFDWRLTGDDRGLIVAADASVPVSVLGREIEFLKVDAHAQDDRKNAKLSFGLDVVFVGQTLYTLSKDFGFKKEDTISFDKEVGASTVVTIGPVPITITGGAKGELGLNYSVAVGGSFQLMAEPFVDIRAFARAELDAVVASAGLELDADLVCDKFTADATAGLEYRASTNELALSYDVNVDNELIGPALELLLTASWKAPKFVGIETRRASKVLLRLESFERKDDLLHNKVDLFTIKLK